MMRKLAFVFLLGGAFLLGVIIYDPTIITRFTGRFATAIQTGLPNAIQTMKENPVTTIVGTTAAVVPFITIVKYIYDVKRKASNALQVADTRMRESTQVASSAIQELETKKVEYTTKTEELLGSLEKNQELVTTLQIENDRLKRENEQLKTEYNLLHNEHESLKERVEYKKVVE